jgi:transcriptional regulator with XRE-family HTH domain
LTLIDELLEQTIYGKKELARQELIVSVTEQIWATLEDSGLSKADLARALETSKSHVTQLLGGNRNMTLATLADIGEAIGVKPRVIFPRAQVAVDAQIAAEGRAALPQAGAKIPSVKIYGNVMEAQAGVTSQSQIGSSSARTPGISAFLAEA